MCQNNNLRAQCFDSEITVKIQTLAIEMCAMCRQPLPHRAWVTQLAQ